MCLPDNGVCQPGPDEAAGRLPQGVGVAGAESGVGTFLTERSNVRYATCEERPPPVRAGFPVRSPVASGGSGPGDFPGSIFSRLYRPGSLFPLNRSRYIVTRPKNPEGKNKTQPLMYRHPEYRL